MKRWVLFSICAVLGLAMVLAGLLVPAHLRAVDDLVLERAGRSTPGLIGQGLALAYERNLGAAELLSRAAQSQKLPGHEKLEAAISTLTQQNPDLRIFGLAEAGELGALFHSAESGSVPTRSLPVTEWIIRSEAREQALELLQHSSNPTVRQLLQFRSVTNTVLFPPSQSASGQALDAALGLSGLLLEGRHLSANLSNAVVTLAAEANQRGGSQAFEQVLMDLMSLGQRFDWGQLTSFVGQMEDAETLRLQANLARKADAQLPILFAAVQLSANPSGVAKYLTTFDQTGLRDLGSSLRFGAGGVNELLQRNQRLHVARFEPWLTDVCLRMPGLALSIKWFFYLAGGFLLALALHHARPAIPILERPLQVRGFHLIREFLFALGFLLVVLLVSEPFLAQESQVASFPLRVRLPTLGSAVPAGTPGVHPSIMNNEILLTMLLFFVLQALLYIACLFKLEEIKRQRVAPRVKLKLLDNEDHLFDAGLYLGFVGTIISLILVSMGVFKQPSLMAAYSATSFGIIFVSLFKIVHLRSARRKILLEAEAVPHTDVVAPTHTLSAPL